MFLCRHWMPAVLLVINLVCAGGAQASDSFTGQWQIPLPQLLLTDKFPAWFQLAIRNDTMVIDNPVTSDRIVGDLRGLQPVTTGWQASALIITLDLFGPDPVELVFTGIALLKDTTGSEWQMTAKSLVVNTPFYRFRINNPSWIWQRNGAWQGTTGSVLIEVPVQVPIAVSNSPNDDTIGWQLLTMTSPGFKGQGSPAGWQGQVGTINLSVPVADQGNGTIRGQGHMDTTDVTVVADGRFFLGNTGGLVDRGLVYWLLGRDIGGDLPMNPFRLEGLLTPAGMQVQARNLLPWLDLWFGEPGAAARHLQSTQQDGIEVLNVRF